MSTSGSFRTIRLRERNDVETFEIRYVIHLPDSGVVEHTLRLHPETMENLDPVPADLPGWAKLNFCQCPNCPLTLDTHPACPLTARFAPLLQGVCHLASTVEVTVEVITPERTVSKTAQAQEVLSSLMGLMAATSSCPHMSFFRPMARHHLPLASLDEILYRVMSMYSLAQVLRHRKGLRTDLDFDGLVARYAEVETVNKAMIERLRVASRQDLTINALVLLDVLSKTVPMMALDDAEEIEKLFASFLRD